MALICFAAVIGLMVNVGKSEIVPIGEISNLDNLAIFLRCMVDSFANEIFGYAFGCSV